MKDLLENNIQLDNEKYVSLKEMLDNQKINDNLVVPLGKSKKEYHYVGFNDIPCLLITGETGSGKSVFLDSLIISLMLKNKVNDIKFIMIDSKKIELSYYTELKYTLNDIVSNSDDSSTVLSYVQKMYERRKELLKNTNLDKYNKKENIPKLFQLFIIIDESINTMSSKENLNILKTITKDCDKVGIHFIIATNSPNENYFDKAFIDSIKYKITFDLASKAEANWIGIRNSQNLQTPGEAIVTSSKQKLRFTLQTPYISDEEIIKVVKYLKYN